MSLVSFLHRYRISDLHKSITRANHRLRDALLIQSMDFVRIYHMYFEYFTSGRHLKQ